MCFLSKLFGKKSKSPSSLNRALLVGINSYPGAPLQGCLNDIADVKKYLMECQGFAEGDIRVVQERDATTRGILDALEWFIDTSGCDPNQCKRYFHYSGHGAQVPTRGPGEPDGLAECICPIDFDWSPDRMITDKQFVSIFARFPAGVKFNWASDSCHSGDLDRSFGAAPASNNPHPKPIEVPRRLLPPPGMLHQIQEHKRKGITSDRTIVNGMLEVGFISGCRSDQTSADTFINGRPCGAFTANYVPALRAIPNGSLSDVGSRTSTNLAGARYDQRPTVTGSRAGNALLR